MDDPHNARVARKLATSRHKYSLIRKQLTMQAQTEGSTLRPWMKELALWITGQAVFPKAEACQARANHITRTNLSLRSIKKLLVNPVFQAFLSQVEEEVTSKAKAHAETRLVGAIEAHFEGIEDLRANKKWETLVKYTNPLLERIWPTNDGPKMPAQIIQIMVGAPGSFAAANAKAPNPIQIEAIQEVEAEIT